ncbi:MAG: hypothetical protein V5A43_11365, partial [Haloarculaceae archaeon]
MRVLYVLRFGAELAANFGRVRAAEDAFDAGSLVGPGGRLSLVVRRVIFVRVRVVVLSRVPVRIRVVIGVRGLVGGVLARGVRARV